VALGDSAIGGEGASAPHRHYVGRLHERLRTVYPRAAQNLGVGGATAADVLSRRLPQALELRPISSRVVGPRHHPRRSLSAYASDIDAILGALTRGTTAVIVVNLIPDLTVTPRFKGKEIEPLVHKRVVAFNEILASRADAYGAEVADLYGASRREVPNRRELIAADGYHPSDEGYARWAELMWAAIERGESNDQGADRVDHTNLRSPHRPAWLGVWRRNPARAGARHPVSVAFASRHSRFDARRAVSAAGRAGPLTGQSSGAMRSTTAAMPTQWRRAPPGIGPGRTRSSRPPRIWTDRTRVRDADTSMHGLKELRVKRAAQSGRHALESASRDVRWMTSDEWHPALMIVKE
jgi:lysophospholipase L1-like esterase